MEKLISEIHALKVEKEALEKEQEVLKDKISALDTDINAKNTELLNKLKELKQDLVEYNDLVAYKGHVDTVAYKDEKEVLKYLKDNGYNNLITIKESLAKNPLKAALKKNEELKKALDDMLENKTTEYVVVTTKENYKQILEHIEENKK